MPSEPEMYLIMELSLIWVPEWGKHGLETNSHSLPHELKMDKLHEQEILVWSYWDLGLLSQHNLIYPEGQLRSTNTVILFSIICFILLSSLHLVVAWQEDLNVPTNGNICINEYHYTNIIYNTINTHTHICIWSLNNMRVGVPNPHAVENTLITFDSP